MTKGEAAGIVVMLATIYDTPIWPEARSLAFRDAILDLDHKATVAAAKRYVATEPRRPTPADIRRIVRDEGRPFVC